MTAKLLQITIRFYYKLQQLIYYRLRQFYCKLRQLLQIATSLLQITTAITNCDNHYKLRQNNSDTGSSKQTVAAITAYCIQLRRAFEC